MRLNLEKLPHKTKQSSLLIVISSFMSKLLAASYRIPYQNLVGDRGFYAYQQIYPLLGIISALGLTALPNVIASMAQKKKQLQLAALFKLQCYTSFLLSGILVLSHKALASWMGAQQLAPSIVITAMVLLIVPFISFYRGLAQADMNMAPTALSQVLEQIIRVAIIIVAALCYRVLGWTVYLTANVAAFGNLVASLVILAYLKRHSAYSLKSFLSGDTVAIRDLTSLGLPTLVFLLFSIYLLVFQLVDSLLVKNILVSSGLSEITAEMTKGVYDRGQPLLQFGLIFSTALFTAYLPNLTALFHVERGIYKEQSQCFFEFIFYFSLTLTVGFISILHLMNRALFEDNKGWLALVVYLMIIAVSSMIQFFHQKCFIEDHIKQSLLILLFGFLLKLGLTPILTYYYAIVGSSLSTLIPLLVVLLLYAVLADIDFKAIVNAKYGLALVIMLMCVLTSQYCLPLSGRLGALISLLVSSAVGLSSFLIACKKLDIFKEKLWSFLPFVKEK
ncbi:TPA: oligosaccharide flippase family protein [Streptococcus equi subsp. zooepidemicus]|uniref:oligosaccharide flippase family protein n=1 Tax=Streptococcus equi TaxID=1336 RepID=UPI001E544902|nr:oligosaccharide flippase family protein [Streptococcus equi subsp. zooepidemicus]HEL0714036.1 oligosaccharide flippase family protein [Streptococcus equi subsp. zooepidemicus]HEL1105573.1 oligosaccharide flippase family protein [Streptococcus equi subsp. zooepidemicus]HEL1307482.1 oligosaccharide flippase family protein [Streptococcus equi subsp. zooepidemicus]